jgi:hypothetical protein
MEILKCSQLGLTVEGLAITKPAPAPGTSEPWGPMLFKAPSKAIALSLSMNESKLLFPDSEGAAKT